MKIAWHLQHFYLACIMVGDVAQKIYTWTYVAMD